MENLNQKCELCSMVSTHSQLDEKKVNHYFCQHHSLKDLQHKKSDIIKLLPLFGVFAFIFLLSFIRQLIHGAEFMMWMMDFMGIFFVVFGLFKLYDLNAFVEGFQTYDVVAKKFRGFGYVYPFIEIILGVTYLAGYMFVWQNLLAMILTGLGLYSVYKVLKNNQAIKCVCLGTLFNLPMTYVTLIENGVMFVMAVYMLFI
jgi:hypothetical protein